MDTIDVYFQYVYEDTGGYCSDGEFVETGIQTIEAMARHNGGILLEVIGNDLTKVMLSFFKKLKNMKLNMNINIYMFNQTISDILNTLPKWNYYRFKKKNGDNIKNYEFWSNIYNQLNHIKYQSFFDKELYHG